MKEHTIYVVQFWVEDYESWKDCAERSEGMFDLPTVGYANFDEATARYEHLRAASPTSSYRVTVRTTTETVLVGRSVSGA
jgi:hypothetical protein